MERLAEILEQRLGDFLTKANISLFPPGTLRPDDQIEQKIETAVDRGTNAGTIRLSGNIEILLTLSADSFRQKN